MWEVENAFYLESEQQCREQCDQVSIKVDEKYNFGGKRLFCRFNEGF